MTAPGATLGKYEVRGELGRGAMGIVYDGWDPVIDRRVAIKTAHLPQPDDLEAQEALSRFKREAQAAGRLGHPNIVGVFDYGETVELAYIVMEFVDGTTLKNLLDAQERLPLAETLRIMDDILAGLAYSHARSVVHRDIKPANIMLTWEGQAKIADFGIARIESSTMTQAGTVLGTPAYMSPEQFMGQIADRRTDIYSAGVLLYVLLTGEKPFDGGLTAIMHKALNTVPPRPSELSVTAPPHLDAVVARAMARRPEDRFADAEAFASALHVGLAAEAAGPDATIMAPRPLARPAPVPAPRRLNPLVLAGSVSLLAVAGAAAWLLLSGIPPALVVASTPEPPAVALPRPAEPPPTNVVPRVDPLVPSDLKPVEPPPVVVVPRPDARPAEPPAPTPPVQVPAHPSAIRAALAAFLAGNRCTLASAEVTENSVVTITGLVGAGEPQSALSRAVGAAKPAGTDWRVSAFDGPYCRVLDFLRPFGPAAGARLRVGMAGDQSFLVDSEQIAVDVTLTDIAGHLHMAYLSNDDKASPLVPGPGYSTRTYTAGSRVEMGRTRSDFEGWHVGPPFGTDMIVAIVSSAPLFAQARPAGEPLDGYLRDLQAAVDNLRRRGGTLAADAVVLETRP